MGRISIRNNATDKTELKGFFKNFIKHFFCIALFIQFLCGCTYFFCHFLSFTEYPETAELLHAARRLVFDEYIGFLYPLLLRGCLNLQSVTGIGFFIFIYLIQLNFFVFSAFYMLRSVLGKRQAFLGTLFVISFPFCMQTILAVSSFSLKTSFDFLISGSLIRIYQNKNGRFFKPAIFLCIAYSLAVFNQPDELYLWGVPIFILSIILIFNKKEGFGIFKKIAIFILCFALLTGNFLVLDKVIEKGNRGRMEKNISSVLFQRVMWPGNDKTYNLLPEEIKEVLSCDEFLYGNAYSEYITTYIGPEVEHTYGITDAGQLYREAVLSRFKTDNRAVCKSVLSDFVSYLFEPYTTILHINKDSNSAFGKLYSLMSAEHSQFTYVYLISSFVTLCFMSLYALFSIVIRKIRKSHLSIKNTFLCFGVLIYQSLFYAIVNVQGVDYRYTLLNTAFFSIAALISIFPAKDEILNSKSREKPETDIKTNRKRKILIRTAAILTIFLCAVTVLFFSHRVSYEESDMLKNKTIVCYGDSILGLVKDDTGIAAYIEKMTGATIFNLAVSGSYASYVDVSDDKNQTAEYSLCEIVNNEHFLSYLDNADILLLEYGLNDYFGGVPIGNSNRDINTYIGAYSYSIDKIKETYPNLEIVLLGQTYCQFYQDGMVADDSDTHFTGSGIGQDYANALSQLASKKDVHYIDMYNSMPVHRYNGTIYLADATHFNETGRKAYAKIVSAYLLEHF